MSAELPEVVVELPPEPALEPEPAPEPALAPEPAPEPAPELVPEPEPSPIPTSVFEILRCALERFERCANELAEFQERLRAAGRDEESVLADTECPEKDALIKIDEAQRLKAIYSIRTAQRNALLTKLTGELETALQLPAVSAFLGSGIATAVINHYLTSRRTREELLRSKLEELFLATSGFCAQVKSSSIPYLRAMQEEITYDQDNDLFLKGEDGLEGHFEKSQMLINLYYPQVLNLFSRLIAARDKADGVRLDFRDACACGERRPETARRFRDALVEFDELRDLLRITLAGLSRDMIKPPSVFVRVRRWFQQRTNRRGRC